VSAPSSSRALGLAVAGVQLTLALSWTVYVLFLPALAAQAGIAASAVIGILMLDQLVFLLADYACGVASDRVRAAQARFGPWLAGATALSALAFLALPWLAPQGSPALFVGVTLLWTATSSVLRAPPMNLIGRHATRPQQPGLVALAMLGLGLAGAAAPYLGLALKGLDPRWPFALASAGVVAAALLLALAERAAAAAPNGKTEQIDSPAATPPPAAARLLLVTAAAVLAAVAFQVHGFLNSTPLYQRFADAAAVPHLVPVFWIGFNLGLWPAARLATRWGPWPVLAGAALLAAAMAALAPVAPTLEMLVLAQALAGLAWAALLAAGFDAALALGQGGRQGRYSGALSSVLALATLLRMGFVAAGLAAAMRATDPALLNALPAWLWGLAALLVVVAAVRRPRGRGV
jgi:MFS family permease